VSQSLMHEVRRITALLDPVALLAMVAIVAASVGLFLLRRRLPLLTFGLASFALLLVPSHVVPLAEAMAEHRVYVACFGFFVAVAGLIAEVDRILGPRWRKLLAGGLVVMVTTRGWLTVVRLRGWSDPVELWTDAAKGAPHTWAAQYGLAEALRGAGRLEDAIPVYQRAIALLPEELDAYLNLGICLAQVNRTDEARQAFLTAARVVPRSPKPYNNLGMLAMVEGQPVQARGFLEQAIERDGKNVRARQLLAQLYETAFRDPARAAALCEEVRAIAPGTAGVDECISRNLARAGARP
jgi:protein O-mannosyl-transferase